MTVKMRRGIDDSAESREKFFEIFDGAFALGVAAITVHGRTVQQRYDGPSRWEFLARAESSMRASASCWAAATCSTPRRAST